MTSQVGTVGYGKGRKQRIEGGVLTKARSLGIAGENEALRLALLAMLGGYQKAIDTLPIGSVARRIVQGAFGHSPELAQRIVEEV